jgi:hypothetical protein
LVNRSGAAKVTAIAVVAVLVAAGAVGIYFYTAAPAGPVTTSSSSGAASSTTSQSQTNSTQSAGPSSGTCVLNEQGQCSQPQGAWADYLGYIPSGYVLAPHFVNANTYPCPSGMDSTQCNLFKASCGNGVCDPNESCATCPIDCGVPGQLTCDPYTGRAGAPISVCQLGGVA